MPNAPGTHVYTLLTLSLLAKRESWQKRYLLATLPGNA
ncbi:hypothetical protein RIEGSTA812A_PEG_190 [invertebrate metagenome]|uniref:Uncharacterized protein n=1 Tax=invertebrate metagenome TaxID=1711999 RepID=A0A484H4Q6_9ZZZZ